MKKLVLTLAVLFSITLNAQEVPFLSHTCAELEYANVLDLKNQYLYFNVSHNGQYLIMLNTKEDRDGFKEFLAASYQTFLEWKATAKENNVKDFTKLIQKKEYNVIFKKYEEYHGTTAQIATAFMVDESGACKMGIYAPEVASRKNEYITSESGVVLIKNDGHLQSVYNVLSQENIEARIKQEVNKEDLFKN